MSIAENREFLHRWRAADGRSRGAESERHALLSNDIELATTPFNVVPGSYKKGLRKAQTVSKPPARKIEKTIFGPFERGVL